MNPASIKLVQDSWAQVTPIADPATRLFYRRLFELDPALELFAHSDMAHQGYLLMQTLGVAVQSLDHPQELLPTVAQLGQRHARYGVQEAHYETVGLALLWTLEQGLGEAFTPAVSDAWAKAYGWLSTTMQQAAREIKLA